MYFVLFAYSGWDTLNYITEEVLDCERLYFVAAREGHLPQILSMIHVTQFTPVAALLINGTLTMFFLIVEDVFELIYYYSFSYWFFKGLTIIGNIYLRFKQPNRRRPLKLNLLCPILFCLCTACLTAIPAYTDSVNSLIGIAVTLSGLPVFVIGHFLVKTKWPPCIKRITSKSGKSLQLLFYCVTIDKDDSTEQSSSDTTDEQS
ncbi:Y+L amino acid transporter 2-like [Rhincodon typus]|uniref:Y+L amino acid transporter 2-like n=1 Tax=Rhincodon typus TaxID=259920 RepID=UPI002030E850|nr:Y+L amino acid transporter 2-like [Rhincodon typus]